MCGRYVSPNQAAIEHYWHIGRENSNPFAERYNVAPQQGNSDNYIPVIRNNQDGQPELAMMQWWLVPFWAKEPRVKYSTFNARAETVATAAAFRTPFQRRRCLIPALGWYEWQPVAGRKQPWFMHAADKGLLHFAGVWDFWGKDEESIDSCSIIVGEACKELAHVHNRMPLILRPDLYGAWLDQGLTDAERVRDLMQPVPADALAFHPVSTRVSNARNQGPELIEPAAA